MPLPSDEARYNFLPNHASRGSGTPCGSSYGRFCILLHPQYGRLRSDETIMWKVHHRIIIASTPTRVNHHNQLEMHYDTLAQNKLGCETLAMCWQILHSYIKEKIADMHANVTCTLWVGSD